MKRIFWVYAFFALAALLSAWVISPASGQGYYRVTQPACTPYYGQQAYQQTQQAQHQTYQKTYPAQKVVAQEIAVAPLIVTIPVESKAVPVHAYGAPYYYSSSDAYREKAYLREVLREELRNLIGGGAAPSVPAPRPAAGPVTTTGNVGGRDVNLKTEGPKVWAPDADTPAALQAKVLAAYRGKGNCVGCHGEGGKDSGDFKLVMDDGKGGFVLTRQTPDKRWKIYAMSSVGAMPPAAASDAGKAMETQSLPDLLQYASQKN